MNLAIEKDTILKRVNGVQNELSELKKLANLSFEAFSTGDGHKLTEYHLHRALEGVFNISAHILSRISGAQATQYAEIAIKLGEFGIVDKDFAENTLVKMAKYRNRLVHFYAEIKNDELYDIVKNHLEDFDTFLSAIKKVLENPEKFGLDAE
ncbi:MAG: DUF86 domain-containing protein [bacterium]|nr:DUF86 domain-containing protein [bacterium]